MKSIGAGSFKGINKKAKITIVCKNKKIYNKTVKKLKKAGAKKAKFKFKKGLIGRGRSVLLRPYYIRRVYV